MLVSPQTLQTAQVVITFYFVKTKLQMEVQITVQNVINALYIKNTKFSQKYNKISFLGNIGVQEPIKTIRSFLSFPSHFSSNSP